jgi:hypothetical protein
MRNWEGPLRYMICCEDVVMRTLMHWRTERDRHFQAHPLHTTYSLIASMVLAGLLVLVFVLSAK